MSIVTNSKLFIAFALLAFASLAHADEMLFADHPLAGRIWDMHSHSFIDEAALLAGTDKANVLLLGETHDNPLHHELQQKLLKARIESAARPASMPALMPALMMEQLDAESQPALDQALAGSNRDEVLSSVTSLIKFADWQAYQPFLAIAVDNKLPVIAANTPNRKLQPVIWRGYAAYDAGELKRLAVEQVWSESRQNYLETYMGGAHCGKLRDELRAGLTRSQRLRDALMVDSAISSIDRGVVAIVGSSHARRDIGLPLYFAARAPSARILSLAFIEVSPGVTDPKTYETGSATDDVPYDLVWFTPRVERIDPCANLNMEAKP
ncbi:MAG: ChaN family lipoprotein [Gallionella sp.]|nr:ChaN family lipoprotein [Gallionella sp.]